MDQNDDKIQDDRLHKAILGAGCITLIIAFAVAFIFLVTSIIDSLC